MFLYQSLDDEICLTCQYFNIERRLMVLGSKLFIEHHAKPGTCSIYRNFSVHWKNKAVRNSFGCQYKRWNELP